MKKYLTFLSCAALLTFGACKGGNNNAVEKDALKGKYEVDLSSAEDILSEELQKNGNLSAYMFLLSQLELTVEFENEKAIFDMSKIASEVIKNLSKNAITMPMALDYKIENDSILFLKAEGKDFQEAGVLKKVGDSYDNLKLISKNDLNKRVEIDLHRVK